MSRWKIIPAIDHYFVTTTIVHWQYVFTSVPYFEVLIESLKYCMANKGLHLHAHVIMPNHAHYIVSADAEKSLSDIMRDYARYTSRKITQLLTQEGRSMLLEVFRQAAIDGRRRNECKVWQDGFHPIALESDEFLRQKIDYLHDNPVRKGYVDKPEEWRYSSARNYFLDDHSIIRVEIL